MLSILLGLLATTQAADSGQAYSGRARQLAVQVPRLEASARVDGVLDEDAWSHAARLIDFSQYQPADGRPAEEPTEVLVWYGPDAIWFGVRAREIHGDVVRATHANRDNIGSDDQVQILLDTYNDRRVAFLFGVNPFGVQQDGTRMDQFGGGAGGQSGAGGGVGINPLEGNVDLNPDYVFESRGRLVPGGYEVEIRIPFKSLRYQEGRAQTWGINVLRRIQHSGFQDVWTPAVRASATFLGQAGTLEGLHDLRRGLVLEMTPTGVMHLDGAPDSSGWRYDRSAEISGDVRWGITQNLSLNATYQPDFSQVEADVGQVLLNARFALFYPEKRPFFLDGLELFDTPNQLIYTRRIDNPDAGFKLAGKVSGMNLAALAAPDSRSSSLTGSRPWFGAMRLRRDLGRNSTVGLVSTTREDGPDHSRLVGADIHLVHSQLYFVQLQAVQSWTESGGAATRGSLYQAMWDRTGRNFGFNYSVQAVAPDFRADVGFVNRTDFMQLQLFNRFTGYGAQDALVQTYSAFIFANRLWPYRAPRLNAAMEGFESVNPQARLRGGWQIAGSLGHSFFSFDPAAYAGYAVQRTTGGVTDTVAYTVPGMMNDLFSAQVSFQTPTWRQLTASAHVGVGATPIFREGSRGREVDAGVTLDIRPSTQMRVAFSLTSQTIDRAKGASRFSTETIPRLKVEYQLTPSIFFRFVGQYAARKLDALMDPQGRPILTNGVLTTASAGNEFRMDWLFSYRPIPGTLVYVGYGSTMNEPDAFRFGSLQRTQDGFFGKISYLFRL
jgi:hypothetical protein